MASHVDETLDKITNCVLGKVKGFLKDKPDRSVSTKDFRSAVEKFAKSCVTSPLINELAKSEETSSEGDIELASHRTMQTCVGSRLKSNLKRGMSRAAALREALSFCRDKPSYKSSIEEQTYELGHDLGGAPTIRGPRRDIPGQGTVGRRVGGLPGRRVPGRGASPCVRARVDSNLKRGMPRVDALKEALLHCRRLANPGRSIPSRRP